MSPGMQWLDPIVTLSMVAGVDRARRPRHERIRAPYRNPVTLAAEAAALDVLSDGRFVLGVGAGWMREEFEAIGVAPASGVPRTDEHIEVLRTLWTEDPATFRGRFTSFEGIVLATQPRTEGGPPIWVGGNTDVALRRALRLGDGWHGFEVFPEDMPDMREPASSGWAKRSAAIRRSWS